MSGLVLVDTSVFIDHLRQDLAPNVLAFRELVQENRVVVGDLVIYELLRGIRHARDARDIEAELSGFQKVEMVDFRVARAAAEQYRSLRTRGITVRSPIDCLIAAYCIETGTPLLHSDRDFDHFERDFGLVVVRP